jgi:putative ABC transport system substrate-binding protein
LFPREGNLAKHIARREFIALIGGAASTSSLFVPLVARAQQPAMPVIGYLSIGSPQFDAVRLAGFHHGLKDTGFVEGRNVAGEYRWADSQNDRLPALAADLVQRSVSVIAAIGGPAPALAAKAATTTIPIVFIIASDPVRQGLVTRLNRPDGNLTGVSNLAAVVAVKQLEALHETVPKAALIGFLVNPTNPTAQLYTRDVQAAAQLLGQKLVIVEASTEEALEPAFASLVKQHAEAILVPSDPFFNSMPDRVVALAARHALPAIYSYSEFARLGGLMSYGPSFGEPFRQAGHYAGRLLKGEKVADLPVMQGTKVELILNFKTAKTLGVTFPLPLSGRADEVIE